MCTIRRMIIVAVIAIGAGLCFGEDASFETGSLNSSISAFGGMGVVNESTVNHGSLQLGADWRFQVPANPYPPFGILFEGGYAGPINNPGSGSALFSVNYVAPVLIGKRLQLFGTAGYTRLFGTGDAVNYGMGLDCLKKNDKAIRFEVRDYYSNDRVHSIAFRVGIGVYVTDF